MAGNNQSNRPNVTFDTDYLDQAIPIEDMIRRFAGIDTRVRGNIPCPIPGGRSLHKHGDKTPSATIVHDGNYCYCHACHKGMSVLNYAKEIYGGSFKDVCYNLIEDFGISIYDCSDIRERQNAIYEKKPYFVESFPLSWDELKMLNIVDEKKVSEEQQSVDEQMRTYVKAYIPWAEGNLDQTSYHRGLSMETLRHFRVGYDPAWKNPTSEYDRVVPRLIIPTSEETFLARSTVKAKDPTEDKKMKCRKFGEINIFNTEALYNPDKPVFIVEGEIDAMSFYEIGHEGTGLGGTGLIRKLADMLSEKPPTQPLVLCQDNDGAGESAISDLKKLLDEAGVFYITPAESIFGNCKDANEALTTNREAFASAVARTEAYATIMYARTQNVPQYILDIKENLKFDDKYTKAQEIRSSWMGHKDNREGFENLLLERASARMEKYEELVNAVKHEIQELYPKYSQDGWKAAEAILARYDEALKKNPLQPPVFAERSDGLNVQQLMDDAILLNELKKIYTSAVGKYGQYEDISKKILTRQQERRDYYANPKAYERNGKGTYTKGE